MGGSDQRKGKEPALFDDKFPEGMRILVVDDNPVCLKVLEVFLRCCKYKPTMVMDARTTLNMLRDGGEEQFDLVITDVHLPDMDGFELLKLIGLEMDLPVIMLSVNQEMETMLKGKAHGACVCLVKPVDINVLKNIWQHVVRKKTSVMNRISSDKDDACKRVRLWTDKDEQNATKSNKCSKKKKNDGDDPDETKEITNGVDNQKKPRVAWTGELQDKFNKVVEQLGIDRAAPKKILQMMNVDYLTRESVASHLQKQRLHLKRDVANHLSDSERQNLSSHVMNHRGSSSYSYGHQRGQPSPAFAFLGSDTLFAPPSVLGAQGVPLQSRNWAMGTVDHGGSMLRHAVLPDARRSHVSGSPFNSYAKTSGHIMLDAFPPSKSGKSHANILREKLLQASNVVPSSHPGGSFAETRNGGMVERVNQLQVQPPELVSQFSTHLSMVPSAVAARRNTQFPCLVGSYSAPWQNVASSSFPGHMDETLLDQSQVNSQLPNLVASPGQILPMLQNEHQNQMEAGFSEQMAPFNMASNTTQIHMTNDNLSPMTKMVNGGSTTSALPNLQAGSSSAPTQMVNGGSISYALPELQAITSMVQTQMVNGGENASDTLPIQEDHIDLRALDDQPIYSNPLLVDDIYANMLNEDLKDDAFFSGGC